MKVDLDKLLELESKATPGEWIYGEYDDGSKAPHLIITNNKYCQSNDDWVVINSEFEEGNLSNPKLIVAMRNSIQDLCLELKAYRRIRTNLEESLAAGLIQGHAKEYVVSILKFMDEVTGTDGENG